MSNEFIDTYKNLEIHDVTSLYSTQQNGVASQEEKITLVEIVNLVLNNSRLRKNLWGEALLSACHF